MPFLLALAIIFLALTLTLPGCAATGRAVAASPGTLDPVANQHPVFTRERLSLTSLYSSAHYGAAASKLSEPQMIVVHYTAIDTLDDTLRFFQPAHLDRQSRADISSGGDVNVSAHYVVDKDGSLYQLAPEDVICRHIIGFNYTAIGIENVAGDAGRLTERQAEATAALVSRIVSRHPSIRYLIGHHEYRDTTLPHYRLYKETEPTYRFTPKQDPGPRFMARVRQLLRDNYQITLAD